MSQLPHLKLRKIDYEALRKKRPGFGGSDIDFRMHAPKLQTQVQNVLTGYKTKKLPRGINPSLILKINLTNYVDESEWKKAGLTVLGNYKDKTLILFSTDEDLREFKKRLGEYSSGPKEGKKSAQHTGFFASIDSIKELEPDDRIGRHFRSEGFNTISKCIDTNNYTLDVELWHTGNKLQVNERVEELRTFITSSNGKVTDTYIDDSIVLLRVKCTGIIMNTLFSMPLISSVDLPPKLSLKIEQQEEISLDEFGTIPSPPNNAAGICIIDSGINSGHPLLKTAIGEAISMPVTLGDPIDEHGHGTKVAGLAMYGNISKCIDNRRFIPQLQIYSARVLNKDNEFDDESLIINQMKDAITYFRNTYSCRVFNISLGDPKLPYNDNKVSPWASLLDTLARELDILIIVSAGNYDADEYMDVSEIQRLYPKYLLNPSSRIIEPATGCNVLTVGSLADRDYLSLVEGSQVRYQPIAQKNQPSPFTRSGFGIGGAIKPDVIEYGGNWAHDGTSIINSKELSIISLNKDYLHKLFASDVGTSFATPRVAHIAAQLINKFPDKSINFIRALIASSCEIPKECVSLLCNLEDKNALYKLCGYGIPNLDNANFSDLNRVILYSENQLPFDMFHVYEVPIPDNFIATNGQRKITVTLAFDSPVRHTRLDYLGTNMAFCLIRGKSVEEVAEAFRLRNKTEGKIDRLSSTSFDCKFEPSSSIRNSGTLQKGEFIMSKSPKDYGDTYYLVVNCIQNWSPDTCSPQKYAVFVALSHEAQIDMYAQIQARLEIPIQIQARIRTV